METTRTQRAVFAVLSMTVTAGWLFAMVVLPATLDPQVGISDALIALVRMAG